MNTRSQDKFKVHYANSERYKKSSIPYMQRLLNFEAKKISNFLKQSSQISLFYCYQRTIQLVVISLRKINFLYLYLYLYASIVEHDHWLIKNCWVGRTEEIENYSKVVVLLFNKNLIICNCFKIGLLCVYNLLLLLVSCQDLPQA